MEFRILVETRLDDRILERELVSRVERPAGIGPEEIGRVAHPFTIYCLPLTNTVGAPSFVFFAKGGQHNCPLTSILFASLLRTVHSDSISTVPIFPVA